MNEGTPSAIATQLSVALADLALQMSTWRGFAADLVAKLGPGHPFVLLEVLAVLPEEVNSRHLRLGANRRQEVIQEFRVSAAVVCEFLQSCLVQNAQENQQMR